MFSRTQRHRGGGGGKQRAGAKVLPGPRPQTMSRFLFMSGSVGFKPSTGYWSSASHKGTKNSLFLIFLGRNK